MVDEVTISEASILLGISRQAIFFAIKKDRLKARKIHDGSWRIDFDSLDVYQKSKYKRECSARFNGDKVYNENALTVQQAAELLGIPVQDTYYLIRSGIMISDRKSAHHVIKREEVLAVKKFLAEEKQVLSGS
jgi:hypothetical protein